jgi:hypothetical protein
MTMSDLERNRQARRKGDILRILVQDYRISMTSVRTLNGALDMLGEAVGPDSMQWHLTYLADQNYIKIWRVRDMPGFRHDRQSQEDPELIRFAKILPKGIQLIDGNAEEDPQVKF